MPSASSQLIRAEIEARMGAYPAFFRVAEGDATVLQSLWDQAKSSYLDNPLPAAFKERLFTYLSRFCRSTYCLAQHSAFLLGRGSVPIDPVAEPLSEDDVLRLVSRPRADEDELAAALQTLEAGSGNWQDPEWERSVTCCATELFLRDSGAADSLITRECEAALTRALGPSEFAWRLMLLSFIRAAHAWSIAHTEVAEDESMRKSLEEFPKLTAWIHSAAEHLSSERASQSGFAASELRELRDEIQRHAKEVEQTSQRYESLVKASAATVWTTDGRGAFVSPQHSWESYTGQAWDAHRDFGWQDALAPPDRERVLAEWAAVLREPSAFRTEVRVWHAASDQYHHCEVRCVPVIDLGGDVGEWIGTTIDIQQRHQAVEALRGRS